MKYLIGTIAGLCLMGSAAMATPVNGTGYVTPDVIFGSGNTNGSFTGVTTNNVELGLRGKLRYNASGAPETTFNYDGDKTYTFQPSDGTAPGNRSLFNFEWTINTDFSGQGGLNLNDLTYLFEIDYDPTIGTDFVWAFDPVNVPNADHAIGTNSTGNGGGVNATDSADYQELIANNNVAQNSWNLGFFPVFDFDPQTEGMFTINLSAFSSNGQVASTSIDIIYGDVPAAVPLPATLPLLFIALGGMGVMTRRRRS